METDACKTELRAYYAGLSASACKLPFNPLQKIMDEYAVAHPDATALSLKTAQYRIIAENFTPHVFLNSPFWGETGLRISEYDGAAGHGAGGWLLLRNQHLCRDADPERYDRYNKAGWFGLHLTYGPFFDYDHHCFSYTAVLEKGLDQIQSEWHNALQNQDITPEQKTYCEAVIKTLDCVRIIGRKFADAAAEKLSGTPDLTPEQKENLTFVRDTAGEVPFRPPRNFREALATLYFLHEIGNVLDGISISVLGQPDRLLRPWFDPAQNYDRLIAAYLLHTDVRVDTDKITDQQYNGGEQADTLILGGADWSELSLRFLRVHRALGLVNPKIHCRISADTPEIYLKEIAQDFLAGRNVLSCLNDDVVIPAQIRAGKEPADAARYVAGGCWEIILEGAEHSAGANCYLSLGKIMEFSIFSEPEIESALGLPFLKLDGAADFEVIFARYAENIRAVIKDMCSTIGELGKVWRNVNPCPFFSAPMCLESLTDYTAGGAKYSPHGLPLTGLTVAVDSLLAIRTLCFEKKICSLTELLDAVRGNWQERPDLRNAALSAPHFGDGNGAAAELAKRLLLAVLPAVDGIPSERGGVFQPGLYSYNDVLYWAGQTAALPNGRKSGDFLEQGLTPSRLKKSAGITSVLNDISVLPLELFPANSVLTISLQKNGLTLDTLAALFRAYCKTGPGMLQLNCLSREELLDAEMHPERHRDLLVRLYGYSVRFISLDEQRRKEFITRTLH